MSDLECNSGLKYKVGDFVKNLCVAKHQNHLTTPVGSIGVITEVDDGDELSYLVRSKDFAWDFWFKESELELVGGVEKDGKQYNPLEVQEGGGHYKTKGIQPIEYGLANNLSFPQVNIVKYVTRHEDKNGLEDLSKSVHYHFFEALRCYGVEGSTELKKRVLKMLGENDDQ